MKRTGIPLPGFRFDKRGNLVRDDTKLPVNIRLQKKAKNKVRIARKGRTK